MKLRTIEIKACGCTVAIRLKAPLDIDEETDVISILDRHARQIQADLANPPANTATPAAQPQEPRP